MAGKRKAPAKATAKKTEATLEFDEETGHYYMVQGKSRTDVGISRRYAEKLLADENA